MDAYHLHPLHQDYGFKDRSINTLFVYGLPDDVKPREIHNLFRLRPGFDSCQLKYTGRGDQVVAFVTFFNHQSAVAALNTLDGVKFDPEAGSVLHIDLARSNSRRKRKPGGGPYVVIDKRQRSKDDTQEGQDTSSEDGDDEHESPQDDDQTSAESIRITADPDSTKANTSHEHEERNNKGDTRQCSTFFIANLGPNCTEEELRQAFSQYPGFNILKLRARGGMPEAFVDFEKVLEASRILQAGGVNVQRGDSQIVGVGLFDSQWGDLREVELARNAMNSLQGSSLSSSDRGGMHMEYARSKMRKT